MRKITLCLCLIFSFYVSSAQTYNYHRFETYATAEKACVGNTSDAFVVKVNLDIDYLLNNGEYYVIDFGSNFNLGVRYAKVLNRYSGTGDADFYLNGSGIGSSKDVCSYVFNRYHRFETFTTLQKAKDRYCGNSTAHDGRYKVNILIDRLLDHDEVYQINLGGSLGTRYCRILNRYNGKGDADFSLDGQSIGNPININCVIDSDNDGIPDDQDNCPNESGPASNNGCPGEPDLSINLNGSVINSDCFGCDNYFSQIGTDRHYLNNPSGIANIDVLVQNLGNATSTSTTVGYYISANSTFESNSDTRIKTSNIGSLSTNSGDYSSVTLFTYDFNSVGGNFWLLIRVDDDDDNDESNENNNVFALRFAIN
ncbi:thrombospondin type 3 repeat-containing protein [Flagellimonas abyssi]|uniref:CARDB domain-containing protein n=1 Tax=Flagellimonas abyssi TaxID=2864871 RepID=A0ABS7EQB0_9FLAO|nr:thrombospondin type 3 repeat-containing protein [Allomuricauda abyssi]MBW8199706.1 hypothetical protein [Allomuricauda abyssi]